MQGYDVFLKESLWLSCQDPFKNRGYEGVKSGESDCLIVGLSKEDNSSDWASSTEVSEEWKAEQRIS